MISETIEKRGTPNLDKLAGLVSRIKYATEVSGNRNSASTSHVATFLIQQTPVRLKMPEAILIDEGDSVVVAGKKKRGILNAYAYKNTTTGAAGKGAVWTFLILGVVFTGVGAPLSLKLFGLPFLGVGLWALYHARQLSKAFQAVNGTT